MQPAAHRAVELRPSQLGAILPTKGQLQLERGQHTFDVSHRLLHHIDKDPLRATLPAEVPTQPPDFPTFTDTYPDEDLVDDDPTVFPSKKQHPIYVFPDEAHHVGDSHGAKLLKWHRITNHLSAKTLRKVAPHVIGMEELLNIPASAVMPKCDTCARALTKHKKLPKATFTRADQPGIRLHCDSSGLIATPSVEGGRYWTVFVDDCSNFRFVDILKNNNAWLEALDRLHVRLGYIYKIVRTDNAGECCSDRAKHYYHVYRIWHERAPAGSRQHHLNPRAENAIGLIASRARVNLIDSGVSIIFWSFAIVYAADVLNMCLPYKSGTGITCFEKHFGKKPNVKDLQPFGCRAYVVIEKKERDGVFHNVTVPGIYLGLAWRYGKKGSCVITDDYKRLYISTDVEFRPACMPAKEKKLLLQASGNNAQLDDDLLNHLTSAKDIEVILKLDSNAEIPKKTDSEVQAMRDAAATRAIYYPDVRPLSAPEPVPTPETPTTEEVPLLDSNAEVQGNLAQSAEGNFEGYGYPEAPAMIETPPETSISALYSTYVKNAVAYLKVSQSAGRFLASNMVALLEEPKDFLEACARKDADEWIEATYKELQQFIDLDAWEAVDPPPGAHVLGTKLVYKLKLNEMNEPIQHKARLVVQGFQMIEGLEFFQAFSAMAHPVTIRLLIAAAVANKWSLSHIDIKGAYLNATLREQIYVRMPKGFERPDGKIMRLKRSVYGLKSAGNYWWKDFAKALTDFGMLPITDDNCLMIKRTGESVLVIATVVDDCILAGNDAGLKDELLKFLQSKYTVSLLGDLNWFLGVHYQRKPDGSILAVQTAYIDKTLEAFNMSDAHPSKLPMSSDFKIEQWDLDNDPPKELVDEYRSKIGALIWLQLWTRPDIAYATNLLARYTLYCTPKLLSAVDKVWRYLKGTRELGIRFTPEDSMGHGMNTLVCYSDASDADCLITRRSTGGHALFFNSAPTSWRSKRHNLVGLSTMDSEAVEVCAGTQQIKHLQAVLKGLGFEQNQTPFHVDNQATIKTAENPCMQQKTKHLGRRYAFIREAVEDKEILLIFTPGKVNIADIFTKPLPYPQFSYLRTLLLNCRADDIHRYQQISKTS